MKSCVALLGAAAAAAFVCLSSFAVEDVKETVGDGGTYTILDVGSGAETHNHDYNYLTGTGGEMTLELKMANKDAKYPTTYLVYNHIKVSAGTLNVIFSNGSGDLPTSVQFANGLIVNAGAKIALPESVKSVQIGRASVNADKNWPTCDVAAMEFAAIDGVQGLVLRDYSTLRKAPEGWTPSATSIQAGATVALQGENVFNLDAATPFDMTHYDIMVLTEASIPAGCTINVPVGRTIGFRPSGIDGDWTWTDVNYSTSTCRINLQGKGSRVLFRNLNGTTPIWAMTDIRGTGEVEFRSETTDGSGNFRCRLNGVAYVSPYAGGRSVVVSIRPSEEPVYGDEWKSKVTHWFDASKADTLVKYDYKKVTGKRYEYLGKYDVIVGWKDAVKSTADDIFLYNRNAMNACKPEYLPYVVTNGLNGLSYVSFGVNLGDIADAADWGSRAKELRWLSFVDKSNNGCPGNVKPSGGFTSIKDKFVIMVFNSANGGGKAILETKAPVSGTAGNLARGSSSLSEPWMAYDGFGLATDGMWTIPTREKPKGRWQILSLDAKDTGAVFQGLGAHQAGSNIAGDGKAGGMDYAEVIFFAERPSDSERFACEQYLAKKWGLEDGYRGTSAMTTFTTVTGTGSNGAMVDLETVNELTAAGDFKGTFNVPAGHKLTIANLPKPPTEKDVPSANRIGWFDPDFAGAIDENANAPGGVDCLYNRTLDGFLKETDDLWFGAQYSATTPTKGRYPFKATGSRAALATTPSRTWLDFSKNHKDETSLTGNTLRFHKMKDREKGISSTANETMTIREGYMALDTSLGGGNPIGCDVEFTGDILARVGNDFASAIWSPNNKIQMAATYLDDQTVDPANGFNGRPEILSFTTASDLRIGYMGYYHSAGQKNYEIIGESLFYSQPLTETERQTVQEYLMYKWLGDLNGKYSDLSGATLKGAGAVEVADVAQLPKIGDFTGTVELTGTTHTFVLGETIERDVALAIPDGSTIVVKASGKVAGGTYTLLQAQSLTADCEQLTLSVVGGTLRGTYSFAVVDNALVLTVYGSGLTVLIR